MTNLITRIRQERQTPATRSSLDEYLQWAQSGFGGQFTVPVQYTADGAPAETIESSFSGYTSGAYKGNSVAFACIAIRAAVFSEARFVWRVRAQNARPGRTFTDSGLEILERPWAGGVTGDLLSKMLLTADLAGNWYGTIIDGELVSLRPDYVQIVLEKREFRGGQVGFKKLGYAYDEGFAKGLPSKDPVIFFPEEVVHFAPTPDPLATFRGMSWLTPVVRDIQADAQMTRYKSQHLAGGGAPQMVVKLDPSVTPELFAAFKDKMEEGNQGIDASKTLYLGGAADVTVVGSSMKEMDFASVQNAGELRVASAAGVPPVLAGLALGLANNSYLSASAARRRFADGTIRPLWRNASASLQTVLTPTGPAELWYDDKDIPFLREDAKDAAEINSTQAAAIQTLTNAGFDPDAVVAAVLSGELEGLKGTHSGMFSVQLQEAGTTDAATSSGRSLAVDDYESLRAEVEAMRSTIQSLSRTSN